MSEEGRTVPWADGSLHFPAGGIDPERIADAANPDLAELTGDARLPPEPNEQGVIESRLKLQALTAAKMMRAAHQAQKALNLAKLFPCQDGDGKPVPADPLTHRDGVSLQILKRLAAQVEKLSLVDLGEDETELDREVKIAQILSLMTRQQGVMELAVAKAVQLSTKAAQEASKLQFDMKRHQDKMNLALKGPMNAADVERIADG